MSKDKINIGLLNSLSGPMAISGKTLISAMTMAIEEINANGGVLGKKINPVVEDGESRHDVYAAKAEKLILDDKVVSIFGCWTSSARKAVKEIVEKYNSLLWYPVQYEGFEESRNIIYTGSCMNQQILPAVKWAISENLCGRCLLVGSDYVFPRTANNLIKAIVSQSGGTVVSEKYFPLDSIDFQPAVEILLNENVDIIFNTINGESNIAFFKTLSKANLNSGTVPVMSFSLSEMEQAYIKEEGFGHYSCWNYFRDIDSDANRAFIEKYEARFEESVPVSAPVVNSYSQIFLWKKIVESCGSFDTADILKTAPGTSFDSPEGVIEILPNHHTRHKALIGRADKNGLFRVISESSVIDPEPWLGIDKSSGPYVGIIMDALRNYSEELHMHCTLSDEIEKRKNLESVLESQNLHLLKLTQAVEQSPVSVVITDIEGNITYVNPKFEHLTGYSFRDVRGKNPSVLKSDHTSLREYKQLWETISAGGVWAGVFLNKKKNGELYWESATISSIKNKDNKNVSFIAIKEDITQQKIIEQALQTSNKKLEEKIIEIENLKNRLYEQAIRDPLTNLYNRRYLYDRIERDFLTAERSNLNLSIAMLDIDHFKNINDEYGHDAGDKVIVNLAKLLEGSIRKTDLVYRYGGEEFLLVFIDCDILSAQDVCEQIRNDFSEYISEINGIKIGATVSAGISSFPVHGNDYRKIISNADEALFLSKNGGRNAVTVWKEK